jgi:hypothetical protein
MCSMLDIHAAWSARLCCGPSGSRRNWLVANEVGASKSTGTNSSEVMPGPYAADQTSCTRILRGGRWRACIPTAHGSPECGPSVVGAAGSCRAAEGAGGGDDAVTGPGAVQQLAPQMRWSRQAHLVATEERRRYVRLHGAIGMRDR